MAIRLAKTPQSGSNISKVKDLGNTIFIHYQSQNQNIGTSNPNSNPNRLAATTISFNTCIMIPLPPRTLI